MNRLVLTAIAVVAAPAAFAQSPSVPYASDSTHKGVEHTTAVLKSGKKLETVKCSDFVALDDSFQPEAIGYAAKYTPRGKPKDGVVAVDGVETVTPVVVADCKAHPGESLVTRVHAALAKKK